MSKKFTKQEVQFIEAILNDTIFGNPLFAEETFNSDDTEDDKEKTELRANIEHYKRNLQHAESRFETLKTNFRNLLNQNEELRKVVGECSQQLESNKSQNTKQAETINNLMEDIRLLNHAFDELESEYSKVHNEKQQLNDVAQKLQTEVRELEDTVNELATQYNKCLEEKDALTRIQKELNEQLADAVWDAIVVDVIRNEKKQIEQQLTTLLTQNESWKHSYTQLSGVYDTLETKLATTKTEKEKLNEEYEKLSELYTDLFSEALDLDEQLDKSKADNRRLSNDYARLSNALHQQTIDNVNKDQTIKDLKILIEDQTACHIESAKVIEKLDENVEILRKNLENEKEATNFYLRLALEVLDKDVEKIIVSKNNEARLMLLKATSDVIHKIPHEVSVYETPEMESKGFKAIEKSESVEESPATTTNRNLIRLWLFVFTVVGILGYAIFQLQ